MRFRDFRNEHGNEHQMESQRETCEAPKPDVIARYVVNDATPLRGVHPTTTRRFLLAHPTSDHTSSDHRADGKGRMHGS